MAATFLIRDGGVPGGSLDGAGDAMLGYPLRGGRMPITDNHACTRTPSPALFMPRHRSDRPRPVPERSKNFAFISQSAEMPDDVAFTVEYSVRAAQIAVYQLLGIDRSIPPVTRHEKSLNVQFEALVKAFK